PARGPAGNALAPQALAGRHKRASGDDLDPLSKDGQHAAKPAEPPPPPPATRDAKPVRTLAATPPAPAKKTDIAIPKPPPPPGAAAPRPMSQCSDSARRPLAERILLWNSRLRRASSAAELIDRYEGARVTCEISDFRSQAALLSLIQARVRTEG